MNQQLLNIDQVAALLAVSRSSVRNAWYSNRLPPPIRIGRRGIRWRADELAEFINAREPAKKPEGAVR